MRAVILILGFTFSGFTAAQGIHKWQDAQGRWHYGDRPPAETQSAEELKLPNNKAPAGEGLRDSEKAALERIQQDQAARAEQQKAQAEQAPAPQGCKGIEILSQAPYTKDTAIGFGVSSDVHVAKVHKNQCVVATLRLPGYEGRLRDSVVDDLLPRFSAEFADGGVYTSRKLKLSGPNRVESRSTYQADMCFGASNYPLQEVRCR